MIEGLNNLFQSVLKYTDISVIRQKTNYANKE